MNWWIISFLELTFLVHFFAHKLVDQYGALYLHYLLVLLPVGSFFLITNWWITCVHGWSGKLWIILLGSGGGGYGVGDPPSADHWGGGVGSPRISDPRTTSCTYCRPTGT